MSPRALGIGSTPEYVDKLVVIGLDADKNEVEILHVVGIAEGGLTAVDRYISRTSDSIYARFAGGFKVVQGPGEGVTLDELAGGK